MKIYTVIDIDLGFSYGSYTDELDATNKAVNALKELIEQEEEWCANCKEWHSEDGVTVLSYTDDQGETKPYMSIVTSTLYSDGTKPVGGWV